MGKDKYKRFQENLTFNNLVQPEFDEIFHKDHKLKGRWGADFFGNDNPIVLELGCGRGEYTVALGEKFPERNFIGIDIKGARMWRGAKTATENEMTNIGFLRTRIEFINSFFGADEVSEIWITFPDPQLKKDRVKKRLTAPAFLEYYAQFLKEDGIVNLKTDSQHLHEYTKTVVTHNDLPQYQVCNDIYGTGYADDVLSIKTTYEVQFLKEGLSITYLRFGLAGKTQFSKPQFDADDLLA